MEMLTHVNDMVSIHHIRNSLSLVNIACSVRDIVDLHQVMRFGFSSCATAKSDISLTINIDYF